MKPIVHSYGGGTQSITILCLIAQGKLPRPERIVMADTGREATSTWDYHHEYVEPLATAHDLKIDIVPHSWSRVDLFTTNGTTFLPVFFRDGQKVSKFIQGSPCSEEWKRDTLRRYLRSIGYGPQNPIRVWLGMSLDEVLRMRKSDVKWAENAYPLIDLGIRRSECYRLVEEMGLPTPPKSSCWCCPHRGIDQWRLLRDRYPDDWKQAIEIEKEINLRHPNPKDGLFLSKQGVPLDSLDMTPSAQETFIDTEECLSGYCFV